MSKHSIIISTASLTPSLTGIGRYTLELAYGMRDLENILYDRGWNWLSKTDLINFYQQHQKNQQNQQNHQHLKNISQKKDLAKKLMANLKRSALIRTAYHALQPIWQKLHLKPFNHLDDAIYHGTNFYVPKNFAGQRIVTIHDLSIFKYPEHHPKARVEMMKKAIDHSLKYANHIITPTEYIRHEIAQYFSYPLNKITATHLAADQRYQKMPADDTYLQFFLNAHQLKYKQYILCVATIEPRKNIDSLINAYLELPENLRLANPLVLAGGYGWESEKLHQKIEKYQHQGWLKYLSYVPEFDLPYLMNGAKFFAFPSVYEGFGLPVLEAMQCGVPVLISKNTCLEEVVGSAGISIDAYDPLAWMKIFQKLLDDDLQCHNMQHASLKQAEQFSWKKTVKQTLLAYQGISD